MSTTKRSITGFVAGMVLFFAAALPTHAAGLSEAQFNAIIALLSAFGADAKVVSNVIAALHGSSPTAEVDLQIVSPNGGGSYVIEEDSITLKYRATNIDNEKITAQLYSPTYGHTGGLVTGYANHGVCSLSSNYCVLDFNLQKADLSRPGTYRMELCALGVDDPHSKKSLCDMSDDSFVLDALPVIVSVSPARSTGKDVDVVQIYGDNFVSLDDENTNETLYVDLLKNGVRKLRLSSDEVNLSVSAGNYATSKGTVHARIQARIDNVALGAGTYELRMMNDAGVSNSLTYVVQ